MEPPLSEERKGLEQYEKLLKIDPLRTGFYKDKISDIILDRKIAVEPDSAIFSGLDLTKIQLPERFVALKQLDFSHNCLKSLDFAVYLQSVVTLNLSHNLLNNIDGIQCLEFLEDLDLSFNSNLFNLTARTSNPSRNLTNWPSCIETLEFKRK